MNPTEEFSSIQNSSEDFRTVLNTSEEFSNVQSTSKRAGGVGRGKKYAGADAPEHDYANDDFMIMEEAYTMFEGQGERRSVRMIAEYCKTGELVCTYDSDDKRWHITRESVQNKIDKIKALNARKVQSNPLPPTEPASEDFTTPPRSAKNTPRQDEYSAETGESIKELEKEILDLKITNRGKDYFIEQLQKERDAFLTMIQDNSHRIGVLETQLLQLEGPSPNPARPTPEHPNRSLPDNINDNHEHSSPHQYTAEEQQTSFE